MSEILQINDIHDTRLDVFIGLKEPQLKKLYEPDVGVFIAESIKVIRRALDGGYSIVSTLICDYMIGPGTADILALSPEVFSAPYEMLKTITGFELTGGILCCMRRKELPSAEALCRNAKRIAVLERVMNPTNVGAIIRSAAAMNIDAVLLTPDCSDPLYRRAARVSMGTVFQIPWTYIDCALDVQKLGFKTAALALTDKTIDISDPVLKAEEKLAIILGSECDGLLPDTIAQSNYAVKIPMREIVDSLNVAAASAVAFWELRK